MQDNEKPFVGGTDAPRLRVLVVDDNEDAADTMSMMLEIMGYDVRVALGGKQAIEIADGFQPAIVLLDIGMPGIDGYDVSRHIRQQPWGKEVVLIALTGWSRSEDVQMAEQAGFDYHLVKPVDPDILENLLASLP